MPSAVSAIKVKGERAYARVRAGEDGRAAGAAGHGAAASTCSRCARARRRSRRPAIDVVDVDVEVDVSSGTYVRALARDLGAALGVGGHLTALRRTRVGPVRRSATPHSLDDLEASVRGGRAGRHTPAPARRGGARAASPCTSLTTAEATRPGLRPADPAAPWPGAEPVAAIDPGRHASSPMLDETRPTARAKVVFAASGAGV